MPQGSSTSSQDAQQQGQGDPGIMANLLQALQDPKVVEALGAGLKSFGSTIGKGLVDKGAGQVDPQFIQQAGQRLNQAQQGAYPPSGGPYVGGGAQFQVPPEAAQHILQMLGIPGGFTPTPTPTPT